MFNWKDFEKNKLILSQDESYVDQAGQHHVFVRPINLLRWIEMSREDLGFLTLVEIAGADYLGDSEKKFRFELVYHLLNMGTHQRLNIHVLFNDLEIVPSITSIFSNADWLEREQWENFGILFDRKMMSLLLPSDQVVFPLRKGGIKIEWPEDIPLKITPLNKNPNKSEAPYPEELYQWKSYGLLSPQSLGLFELDACYDPDKIVKTQINVGFYHQGLESSFGNIQWLRSLHLVDKINVGISPYFGVAWAKNLEDLIRIKIPERAQAIRIVFLELSRVAEHLTVMHEMAIALSLDEHRLFLNAREKIYELVEKYCGRRQGVGIVRLGGVKEDLPFGWIAEYQSTADVVLKNLAIIHRSLLSQYTFRENLNTSEVSAQTALQWGVSGPAMRACGLNFDLRKSQPFYFYQDIDFDIPVGIHGSSYERYLIRYEEIFQSFRIITQVIDNLPMGGVINPDWDLDYFQIQDLLEKQDLPEGWHYTGLEAPNGESGFYVKYNRTTFPSRVKIKTASLPLAQSLSMMIKDVKEVQLRACMASLGIRQTELDR